MLGGLADVPDGDLAWAAAPGVAGAFGDLVRDLTTRHGIPASGRA